MKYFQNINICMIFTCFLAGCCAKERTRITYDCETKKTIRRTITNRIYMMYNGDIGISDTYYSSSYIAPNSQICNQIYFKELLKNTTIGKDSIVKVLCNATPLHVVGQSNEVCSFLEIITILDK